MCPLADTVARSPSQFQKVAIIQRMKMWFNHQLLSDQVLTFRTIDILKQNIDRALNMNGSQDLNENRKFFNSLKDFMMLFNIEPEIIDSVVRESYNLEIGKGEVFTQNFEDSAICFVQSGMVHCSKEFSEDAIFNLGFFCSKHILPTEDTLISPGKIAPITLTRAVEDSVLTILPGHTITRFVKESEEFFRFVLDCYTRRNIGFRDWLLLKETLDKRQFFIFTLTLFYENLSCAGERDIHISAREFAEVTGSSRQYVTEIFSELVRENVIERRYRSFILKDINKLKSKIEKKELYAHMTGHLIDGISTQNTDKK